MDSEAFLLFVWSCRHSV